MADTEACELEQLRAENHRLREALEKVKEQSEQRGWYTDRARCFACKMIVRGALEGRKRDGV